MRAFGDGESDRDRALEVIRVARVKANVYFLLCAIAALFIVVLSLVLNGAVKAGNNPLIVISALALLALGSSALASVVAGVKVLRVTRTLQERLDRTGSISGDDDDRKGSSHGPHVTRHRLRRREEGLGPGRRVEE